MPTQSPQHSNPYRKKSPTATTVQKSTRKCVAVVPSSLVPEKTQLCEAKAAPAEKDSVRQEKVQHYFNIIQPSEC